MLQIFYSQNILGLPLLPGGVIKIIHCKISFHSVLHFLLLIQMYVNTI